MVHSTGVYTCDGVKFGYVMRMRRAVMEAGEDGEGAEDVPGKIEKLCHRDRVSKQTTSCSKLRATVGNARDQ